MTLGLPSPRPLPKPSDIKMIISDVDGTLLDSHHQLPETNPTYQILTRLRKTHPTLPIVISTGKQHRSTADLRQLLDLSPFPACHVNGNIIYTAQGEIISESALPWSTVRSAYDLAKQHHATYFVYDHAVVYQLTSGNDDINGNFWAEKLRGYGEDVRKSTIEEIEQSGMKIIKVAICQEETQLAETRQAVEKVMHRTNEFSIVQALTFCAELIPRGFNKGAALVSLLEWMKKQGVDIAAENVIAFGDGENDISMFREAGMAVAMGNAMQKAKDEADWETVTNDEGGVGRFLEKVFWPELN